MSDPTELSLDALAHVSGGRTHHHHHAQPPAAAHASNPFTSWLDSMYHGIVDHFAGSIGGTKLAEKMYGSHVTASDKTRSQAAMKKFLDDGHKLPKGVPNIFG